MGKKEKYLAMVEVMKVSSELEKKSKQKNKLKKAKKLAKNKKRLYSVVEASRNKFAYGESVIFDSIDKKNISDLDYGKLSNIYQAITMRG